jgi:hypothetical protein
MNESEVARIAQKIYHQHKRALDVIFEHRPDNLKLISDELQRLLRENEAKLGIIVEASTKSSVRFLPTVWDLPQNSKGKSWGGSNRTVLFEVNLTGETPYLLLYAGNPPKDWILPLWERANKPPFNIGRRQKTLPKSWFKLHVHPKKVKIVDEPPGSSSETAERIFKWIADALGDKEMKEVIAILADELKTLDIDGTHGSPH